MKIKILKEIITERKSIYPSQYTEGEIPTHQLFDILNVAVQTPNHKKTEPWLFELFQGERKAELAQEMAKLYQIHTPPEQFKESKHQSIQPKIEKTAAIVTIGVKFSGEVPEWEEIAAVAMGVQNMYLACTAYGLGCYWSSPAYCKYLSDFLSFEENERCLGLFYIGNYANS